MGSWIKIFSKFLQWEWFDKAEMVQLFIYLLLRANRNDMSWRGIPVRRGQLLTSRDKISKETGLTERRVRTCISRLLTTNEISVKTTNKYSIITICKYEEYQDDLQGKRPANDQQGERQTTNEISVKTTNKYSNITICKYEKYQDDLQGKRPANDQQGERQTTGRATTSKEYKNIINKEISISEDIDTKKSRMAAPSSAFDEAEASEPNEKIAEIKELWNATCTGFPRLVVISENRRNKIRNRVAEMGGYAKAIPLLKKIFEKMQQSKFLKGDNTRGWKASFDWLFENDKNWVKVFEGNYDNKPEQQNTRFTNNRNCNDEWE